MKVILFANSDWYLFNFRRSLAIALQENEHDVVLISPPGPYGKKLRELGLRWESLEMSRRSLQPVRELWLFWRLFRLFRRERPALVHGFTIKCAIYGSLAARLARVPARINAVAGLGYVFVSHDVLARLLRPVVQALFRIAFGGSGARLILQNPDDVAFFKRFRLAATDQIHLIPGSGVNCNRFTDKKGSSGFVRVGAGSGSMRVLLASRLLWDKGVAEYVQAARLLKAEGRKIDFLVAGNPDRENPAAIPEALVKDWSAEGLIKWLGHVEDMAGLLSEVDVVALPSYREGLPKSLIEASACGLPIVTTDVPGCREVVTNGVNGLLIPARDGDALAGALAKLQDDPELARRLGISARERALAVFDERLIIGQTIAVYREALG